MIELACVDTDALEIESFPNSDFTTLSSSSRIVAKVPVKKSRKRVRQEGKDSLVLTATTVAMSMKPPRMAINCHELPFLLMKAVNAANVDLLRSYSKSFMEEDCLFRCIKPYMSRDAVGVANIIEFYEQSLQACPDLILVGRQSKSIRINETKTLIKCKIYASGTRVPDLGNDCLPAQASIAELVDPKKVSLSEKLTIRAKEQVLVSQGKLIRIFLKGTVRVIINESKQKAEYYEQKMSMSSFQGC